MASKLIKLTDSNGNLLIPAVVSQAVQVKNGTTPVDLQTAYEGIKSAISGISLAQIDGLKQSLTYASYISQPASNQISYYLINGDGNVKTNTFTINDVAHASSADDATNASKLTTGKLTYTGSTGALTYNFGDGDKSVTILGNTNTYGFVKLGTGAGHAATGNHTHSISYDGDTGKITAGGNTTAKGIIASTSTYGFTKLDSTPKNGSNNTVPSSYIYNSYQYVKEQLDSKSSWDHVHYLYGSNVNYTGDAGNSVNVMIGFKDLTIHTSTPNSSPVAMSYYSYSVPTQKYVDNTFLTKSEFETFSTSGMHYKGTTGTGNTFSPTTKTAGDVYIVGKAGHGVNGSEVGDFIVYNGSSWDIWDKNVTGAMYKGSNTLTTNNLIAAADENGLVKTVNVLPGDIDIDTTTNGAKLSFFDNPTSFNGSLDEMSRVNFIGENGITVSVDKTNINPDSVYRGAIKISSSHTGSGTAGKLLYWETAAKHSAITSTYGYDNANNIGLMFVDGGALKNISKISGSPSIPTYVAEGYIRPVSSIDSSLYYNDSYIILNGSNQVSTVDGANVAATTNLLYLHASSSNYKDTPIKIVGTKGIRVSSQDSGRTLNIEQNFAQADVVTGVSLTHSTYYYEATNVTVDDFTLYSFETTKKYLENASINSTLAYVRQNN